MTNKSQLAEKTCFYYQQKMNKCCQKKECRYFQNNIPESQNCIINKSNEKEHTLEEIGNIFEISRMRICQLEKQIILKIKETVANQYLS